MHHKKSVGQTYHGVSWSIKDSQSIETLSQHPQKDAGLTWMSTRDMDVVAAQLAAGMKFSGN